MVSRKNWRVLDTGLRGAAENIALNKALLQLHRDGEIPNTIRFLRFTPSALVGFHQSVNQELRTSYCIENNIEIQRRITGGGAIYFDQAQLGWELYFGRGDLGSADFDEIARRICEAAAVAISKLGVQARFRPRNDIEVHGKKVSGTGGTFDGGSVMYQGTLLLDFDVEKMLRVLRIPMEKINDKAIASAKERVTTLKELLGDVPDLETAKQQLILAFSQAFNIETYAENSLSAQEEQVYESALLEVKSPDWVLGIDQAMEHARVRTGIYRCAGGLIRANVFLDELKGRVKQLWFTGDFFINPRRAIFDLEAELKGVCVESVAETITTFFRDYDAQMLGLTAGDFINAFEMALSGETQQHV